MAQEVTLTNLRKRRGVIQGSCTRINSYVDTIATVTSPIAAQLEERRAKLDVLWSDYDSVQSELELIDEEEMCNRAKFEESFFSLSAKMCELLTSTHRTQSETAPTTSTSAITNLPESLLHIRLPKINLSKFTGKYEEWLPFYDSFQSIIHANPSISDVQKLQYLKATLAGDASKVVDSLEISAANYQVAWNVLKQRYDNKRIIVQSHVKALLELPALTRENVNKLRQIADGATRHLQALQALNRPTAQWDDLLVQILSTKLDSLSMREWQSSLTTTELPTLRQFIEFVTQRCQILEASSKPSLAPSKNVNIHIPSGSKRATACVAAVKIKCSLAAENIQYIIARIFWHSQFLKESLKFENANSVLTVYDPQIMHPANARQALAKFAI